MSDGGGGRWIKIGGLLLGLALIAALVTAMLDSGNLGSPDESRRALHPNGFSIVVPASWGATPRFSRGKAPDSIQLAPEKVTGRETAIDVLRYPERPAAADGTEPTTFQGKPALRASYETKHDYGYRIVFERDGAWYVISLTSPIPLEWEKSALMRYAETFRTDRPAARIPALVATQPITVEPE